MANSTTTKESPSIPWLFLGGVLTLLIGFGISYFGGFLLNGGGNCVRPTNKVPGLALVGLGIAVFTLGALLLARIEPVRGSQLSLITVAFIMAPLPSGAAYLINFLGNYVRRTGSTTIQAILVALGIFQLAFAATWAWEVSQPGAVRISVQAFLWPVLADFGVVCLMLAALPACAQSKRVEQTSA
jgi:hypothetical protein